jgi:CRISPR/Cas system-associated endonuclease Cas3-HD
MAIKDYSTYIPTESVDWGKITEGLIGNINAVETGRKENNLAVEKEKEALDLIMTDANALMSKQELYSNQDLSDFILNGANTGREKISEWNKLLKSGELSPKDYKKRINNLSNNWSALAQTAKDFDATNKTFMDRQIVDPKTGKPLGSGFEEYLAQIQAEIGDLKNKKLFVDNESGNSYISKISDGKVVDMRSTMSYSKPNNFFDDYFDVDKTINDFTKTLEPYKIEKADSKGNKIIEDPFQNPATARFVVTFENAMLGNPRYVSAVLEKYYGADIDYYRTDEEKNQKINNLFEVEKKVRASLKQPDYTAEEEKKLKEELAETLMYTALDQNQVYQPVPSQKQIDKTKQIIDDEIRSQVGYVGAIESISRGSGGGSGGGSGYKPPSGSEKRIQETAKQQAAFFNQVLNSWGKPAKISAMLGNKYDVKWDKTKGMLIRPKGSKDSFNIYAHPREAFDLFGYGSAGNQIEWNSFFK